MWRTDSKKRHVTALVIGLFAIAMAATGGGLSLLETEFVGASIIGASLGIGLGLLAVFLSASGRGSANEGNTNLARRLGFRAGVVSILLGLAALIPFFLTIYSIACMG